MATTTQTTPEIAVVHIYQGLAVAFYVGTPLTLDNPASPELWERYDLLLPYGGGKEDELLQAMEEQGEAFNMQAWIDSV